MLRNQRLGQNNRDLGKPLPLFSGENTSGTRHGEVAGACKEQTGFCASGEGTAGHDKCPSTVPSENAGAASQLYRVRCLHCFLWGIDAPEAGCLLFKATSGGFLLLSSCSVMDVQLWKRKRVQEKRREKRERGREGKGEMYVRTERRKAYFSMSWYPSYWSPPGTLKNQLEQERKDRWHSITLLKVCS